MESVSEVTYSNGVTLKAKTAEGWKAVEADGTEHTFESVPAFMTWCRTNYSWPMV